MNEWLDGLTIAVNMGGWVIVGWFFKREWDKGKELELKLKIAEKQIKSLEIMLAVQDERIKHITDSIAHIQAIIKQNNDDLIRELKAELRRHKNSDI